MLVRPALCEASENQLASIRSLISRVPGCRRWRTRVRCSRQIRVWATGAVAVGGAAGPFASPVCFKLPTGFRPTAALTAGVNADGAGDFVVAGDAGQLLAFLSDARGGFTMSPPTPCGAHPSSLAAGDLTRDGRVDVVVANHETDYITLLVGDGAGVFAHGSFASIPIRTHMASRLAISTAMRVSTSSWTAGRRIT
jgi:hypothetical protein